VQLGGNSTYFGKKVEKPTMGDAIREITASDILATNRLMLTGAGLFVVLMLVSRLIVVGIAGG
jgi:adenosylcobinamide-phosphate synthase